MARYRDVRGVGRSRVVPYREGEHYADRHARRLREARKRLGDVRQWCRPRGIRLSVTNEQHHWSFLLGDRLAEWWPSSAKLVFDKQYQEGVHAHDVHQVIQEIRRRWNVC